MPRLLFLNLILMSTLSGCELINPEEAIPSWIEVDHFNLIDNPQLFEGELSENIVDAWISIDGNRIGTFELPCKIPVLEQGKHQIVVSAGVLVSGRAKLRYDYIYYSKDTFNLDLQPGQSYYLEPEISYVSSSLQNIIVIEDFENADDKIISANYSNAKFIRTSDQDLVEYGLGCGIQTIDDTVSNASFRSIGNLTLPQNGTVFLEIDYASDYPVEWGLYVNSTTQDLSIEIITLKSSSGEWKKQYLALDSCLSVAFYNYHPESFYVYAKTLIEEGPNSGNVRIDNVKVLFIED